MQSPQSALLGLVRIGRKWLKSSSPPFRSVVGLRGYFINCSYFFHFILQIWRFKDTHFLPVCELTDSWKHTVCYQQPEVFTTSSGIRECRHHSRADRNSRRSGWALWQPRNKGSGVRKERKYPSLNSFNFSGMGSIHSFLCYSHSLAGIYHESLWKDLERLGKPWWNQFLMTTMLLSLTQPPIHPQ